MERCKGDFYVSLVRNLRFPKQNMVVGLWVYIGGFCCFCVGM